MNEQIEPAEVAQTADALARGEDPWAPSGPQNETEWDLCAASWRALTRRRETEIERLRDALRVIAGPDDHEPWTTVYCEAGAGYEGLRAIAHHALDAR